MRGNLYTINLPGGKKKKSIRPAILRSTEDPYQPDNHFTNWYLSLYANWPRSSLVDGGLHGHIRQPLVQQRRTSDAQRAMQNICPLRMAWIKRQATLEDTLDCGVSRSMMMSYQISPTFETHLPTWALHLGPSAAHSRPHQTCHSGENPTRRASYFPSTSGFCIADPTFVEDITVTIRMYVFSYPSCTIYVALP